MARVGVGNNVETRCEEDEHDPNGDNTCMPGEEINNGNMENDDPVEDEENEGTYVIKPYTS